MKSLKEHLLDERQAEAIDLVARLRGGYFDDYEDLLAYIEEHYGIEPLGSGSFSRVISGTNGKEYVLKTSRESSAYKVDDWWRFAQIAIKHGSKSSMFPEILFSGEILVNSEESDDKIGVAILEGVSVAANRKMTHDWAYFDDFQNFGELKDLLLAGVKSKDLFDRWIKWRRDLQLNALKHDDRVDPEDYEDKADEYVENLVKWYRERSEFGFDPEEFRKFVTVIGKDASYDIHNDNYGKATADGRMVIFDPVSWKKT